MANIVRGRRSRKLTEGMKTVVYLIRHGETEWNAEQRIQGNSDIDLGAHGVWQGKQTALRLASVHLDKIITSDLKRAQRTAQIIAERNRAPVVVREDIRERNWGIFEGKTWSEISKAFPEEMDKIVDGGLDYAPPEGESKNEVHERIVKAFYHILEDERGGTVAIVSHGGALALLIKQLLGMDIGRRTPFVMSNCGITRIEAHTNDFFIATVINDTSHLND